MIPDQPDNSGGPQLTPFDQLPARMREAYNNLALQLNRCGVRFDAEVDLDGAGLSRLIAPQLVEAFVQGNLCITHRRTLASLLSLGTACSMGLGETASLIDDSTDRFDNEVDQLRALSGCVGTLMTQFAALLHCEHQFIRNIIQKDN